MSAKNKQIYSKLTHINEEEEPCLKALRRKIRSYNKKLDDIQETEGKDFLRPEQLEKINRKQKYESERDKCVDFTVVYREILLENQDYYRAQQLKQINDLALILSVMQSDNFRKKVEGSGKSVLFGGSEKFQKENMTLQELYDNIRNTLTEVANSKQIKSMAQKYFEENNNENIKTMPKILEWKTTQISNEKKTIETPNKNQSNIQESTKIDEKPEDTRILQEETKKTDSKNNEAKEEQGKKQQDEGKDKGDEGSWDHSADMIDENDDLEGGQNKSRQKSEIVVHSKNYQDSQKPENRESDKKGPFKSAEKLEQEKYGRSNRNPAHNIKFNRIKRSNSKQKYHQRARDQLGKNSKQQIHHNQNADGSDEDPDEPRKFNEQEIKQLEDDGFIVVGKPKPKKNSHSHHGGHSRRGNRQRNY